MPRYDWECQNPDCKSTTEVYRSMSDSDVGPYGKCEGCGGTLFTKKFSAHQVLIPGGGSAASSIWPLRVPKLEKVFAKNPDGTYQRDQYGRAIFHKRDVIFKDKAHQDSWLAERGLARMMDGEADSTVHEESTHSVYHQGDTPAPNERANVKAQGSFFVEKTEAEHYLGEPIKSEIVSTPAS